MTRMGRNRIPRTVSRISPNTAVRDRAFEIINKGKVAGMCEFLNKKKSINYSFRVDACESKVEIVTPYWASNSAGKVRAIVNTQHFEQAIHQEVCS